MHAGCAARSLERRKELAILATPLALHVLHEPFEFGRMIFFRRAQNRFIEGRFR
jgi:hypothetical protein